MEKLRISPRHNHHPKTKVVVVEEVEKSISVGRPAEPGVVVPGPATHHAFGTFHGTLRVLLRLLIIVIVPILAPFPHVSVHVIHAPRIRRFLAYSMSCFFAVAVIPSG